MKDFDEKKERDLAKGLKEQHVFVKFARDNGYIVGDEYNIIDDYNHIDNDIIVNNIKHIFDFKGSKFAHSQGETWLETRGNSLLPDGRHTKGWLFSENINSLVLELPTEYILYDLIKIREFYLTKIKFNMNRTVYLEKPDEVYKYYKRLDKNGKRKNDITFKIPLKDIEEFVIIKINKY